MTPARFAQERPTPLGTLALTASGGSNTGFLWTIASLDPLIPPNGTISGTETLLLTLAANETVTVIVSGYSGSARGDFGISYRNQQDVFVLIAERFPANARTSEFHDVLLNNLQAIWTDQIEFEAGVAQAQQLCQEILDKEPA